MDPLDEFSQKHMQGTFYQRMVIGLLSLMNLAAGTFMIIVSVVLPSIGQDFALSEFQVAVITSAHQFGGIFGSLIGGSAASTYGRSPVIKIVLVLQALAAFFTACSNDFYSITVGSFMFGVFVGLCMNVVTTYAMEICPVDVRGRWAVFLNSFLTFGKITSALMAYLFLDYEVPKSWKNVMFMLSLGVLIICPFVLIVLKESTRFLFMKKRPTEFVKRFNKILLINQKFVKKNERIAQITEEDVLAVMRQVDTESQKSTYNNYLSIFSDSNLHLTILLCLMWTCQSINIAGQLVIISYWFKGTKNSSMLLTVSGELLAICLSYFLIDRASFGRLKSLRGFSVMVTLLFSLSFFVENNLLLIGLFILTRMSIKGAFVMMIPFSAEVYPTSIRSIALGFILAVSSVMTALMPFILFPLYRWYNYSVFIFFALNGLVAFLCSLALKNDTTNKSLDLQRNDEVKESFCDLETEGSESKLI